MAIFIPDKMALHIPIKIPHSGLQNTTIVANVIPILPVMNKRRSCSTHYNTPVPTRNEVVVVPCIQTQGISIG